MAAIDFQPLNTSEDYFIGKNYKPYEFIFNKWQNQFPTGGNLPQEAIQYFSPYAIWTRFPHSDDNNMIPLLDEALSDYLMSYKDILIKTTNKCMSNNIDRKLIMGNYLNYRIEKDPAKGILYASFGNEWTEYVLNSVLFPKEE